MPPGFREAYRAYVEGGWGTLAGPAEYGGQGLPLTLASVVMEDLGSANMGFSLVHDADPGRGRGAQASRHAGAAAGLAAEADHRRMDRDDEPDRVAGRARTSAR